MIKAYYSIKASNISDRQSRTNYYSTLLNPIGRRTLLVNHATIFPCASLTKAVISAAIGLCVEDGKFTWDTPVKEFYRTFTQEARSYIII